MNVNVQPRGSQTDAMGHRAIVPMLPESEFKVAGTTGTGHPAWLRDSDPGYSEGASFGF